jgi:hypothetical protein
VTFYRFHHAQQAGLSVPAGSAATVEEGQSALKALQINLAGNQLKAYALFHIYGKDISLQIDGILETRDRYVRLTSTAEKPGALPIPQTMLGHVVGSCLSHRRIVGIFRSLRRSDRSALRTAPSSSRRDRVCVTSACCIFAAACFLPATERLEIEEIGW